MPVGDAAQWVDERLSSHQKWGPVRIFEVAQGRGLIGVDPGAFKPGAQERGQQLAPLALSALLFRVTRRGAKPGRETREAALELLKPALQWKAPVWLPPPGVRSP